MPPRDSRTTSDVANEKKRFGKEAGPGKGKNYERKKLMPYIQPLGKRKVMGLEDPYEPHVLKKYRSRNHRGVA